MTLTFFPPTRCPTPHPPIIGRLSVFPTVFPAVPGMGTKEWDQSHPSANVSSRPHDWDFVMALKFYLGHFGKGRHYKGLFVVGVIYF